MKSLLSRLRRTPVFLAGALFFAGSASLPAAIVSWDAGDVTTPIGASYDDSGIWFNFFDGSVSVLQSGDGYPAFALGQFQINLNGSNGYLNLVNQTPFVSAAEWVTYGNGPARLAFGDTIDDGQFFTGNPNTIFGSNDGEFGFFNSFDDLGTGYIGVKFTDTFVNLYYGYIALTVNQDYTVTLHGFAYESTPETDILAGATAIPEPSSAAALAGTALLGLAILRRRRR